MLYSLHVNKFTKQKDFLKPLYLLFIYLFVCQAKFKNVMIVGSYHLSAKESSLITLGNAGLWREVRRLG